MPGIESAAPERTERRSGAAASPNVAPATASTPLSASSTSSQRPGGSAPPTF